MGDRGRKSVAELSVVGGIEPVPRPRPPSELTQMQANEWNRITSALPAENFGPEKRSLLMAYCRHAEAQEKLAQLIEAETSSDDFDVVRYDRLLKCQERESRCMASLAVRLNIANTTYEPKKHPAGKVPWQS